ncbi:hypothetical protein T552_02873 [Pneumocystis carinii B80]|uniref:mRNA-capping enzyme subunit beta n=1 Tax=Pneumocystis carinii (strain B80) TaxID=1408658 RepID=A0A0W4ZDK5_PNEC8|nr:hypothetical protein T552_02873 [Pneumocystis carinii B80]KTW26391.1 hypothetical protein T552_02873 [Pneumocystis carinii B80]
MLDKKEAPITTETQDSPSNPSDNVLSVKYQNITEMTDENPSKRPCSEAPSSITCEEYAGVVNISSSALDNERSDFSLYQVSSKELNVPKPLPEPSFLNIMPHDELIRFVSDFLFHNCITESLKYVEIEAKIGHIVDVVTGERLWLPVLTETIINSNELKIKFESNMTELQHKYFNRFLNVSFEKSQIKNKGQPRIPMKYKHKKEIDKFYNDPLSSQGFQNRIRITTDKRTGQVISRLIKTRVASLNIFSPRTQFDWRISVNVEIPFEPRPLGALIMERDKDRLSYVHQFCQIDLSQVISENGSKTHELEVELLNIDELKKHGNAASHGQPNNFENIVRIFVDNVRILVRQNIANTH